MLTVLLLSVAIVCQAAAALLAIRLIPVVPRRLPWLFFVLAVIALLLHLLVQFYNTLHAARSSLLLNVLFHVPVAVLLLAGMHTMRSVFRDHKHALQVSDEALLQLCRETRDAEEDISRMRQLHQENQSYMHTITHDLRNPLTVVLGHAEMLHPEVLRCCEGETPRVNIESIILAGQQMERMMEDLLDMAGMEGGAIQLQQEVIHLEQFLRDYLIRAQVSLDTARIRLELPAQEAVAWVDPKYLERFLNNLLSNALKYSASATPVDLRVNSLDEEILIAVTDQGQGITSDDLARIFERFYRADNAKGKSGLGLGLYITRLLVEAHGGRIWAESGPDCGSTFYLALPNAAAADMIGYKNNILLGDLA
jgi:signal transduction histidine kinase